MSLQRRSTASGLDRTIWAMTDGAPVAEADMLVASGSELSAFTIQ